MLVGQLVGKIHFYSNVSCLIVLSSCGYFSKLSFTIDYIAFAFIMLTLSTVNAHIRDFMNCL